MGWFPAKKPLHLQCHKCKTRFTVGNRKSLRDRTTTTCRRCGTPFGVCVVHAWPEESYRPHEPPFEHLSHGLHAPMVEEEPRTHRFFFRGKGGTLFGIHIVNLFLTLITLGIYSFWAKTKVRNYLWSHTEFMGDRLAYHGTGLELFKGYLKAIVVFGLPYFALTNGPQLFGAPFEWQLAGQALSGLLGLLFLLPVVLVAIRRYRLSRTSWRGIRFSFRGKFWAFIQIWLKGWFLTVITLGLYYPYFETNQQGFFISKSHLGNRSFRFHGEGSYLFSSFLVPYYFTLAIVLLILFLAFGVNRLGISTINVNSGQLSGMVILGVLTLLFIILPLLWLRYHVKKQRYFWGKTSLAQSRFQLSITPWGFFKLKGGNFFLLVLSLGLAWPWTTIRNIRFILRHLTFNGPSDLEAILQETRVVTPTGEGLENFLDTGFELA